MTDKEIAVNIHKAFKMLNKDTSWKATTGSNKAAKELILQMTAMNIVLKKFGYMTNDNGRLVKYKKVHDPLIELAIKAFKGDSKAAEKLLQMCNKD